LLRTILAWFFQSFRIMSRSLLQPIVPKAAKRVWPLAAVFFAIASANHAPLLATACVGDARPAEMFEAETFPLDVHVLQELGLLELEARQARAQQACHDPNARRPLRGHIGPNIIRAARAHLDLPMGSGHAVLIDSKKYLFCLEPHYRPPGTGNGRPEGWHKGVTVYEMT
jgi:hypothetical protein